MHTSIQFTLTAAILCTLLFGCSKSSRSPKNPEPTPTAAMTVHQNYPVATYDRLVNTGPDPAHVRVILELDELSLETRAEVTLLEGHADLFQ